MPSLVLRRTNGDVIASIELSEQQLADIHTITWDRDKHRLYFSLKYTFHAELRKIEDPGPTHVCERECGRSKSETKRIKAQTEGKEGS